MKKKLIFAGAGHSHIKSLANLDRFVEAGAAVTVVNRSEYHYYSGMGPGLLSGYYSLEDARFNIREMVESSGGRFIKAEIIKILPGEKKIILSDDSELYYDLISFNTGSDVVNIPVSDGAENIFPVKPVENILLIREQIKLFNRRIKIAVAGGGASGVEIASNLSEFVSRNGIDSEICIISSGRLLPGYGNFFYKRSLNNLKQNGIKIYENSKIEMMESDKILLASGGRIGYDIAVNSAGIKSSSLFSVSDMRTGNDGGLLVNSYLQSAEYPEIFAAGDCITFELQPLPKVGVYAVREGLILYRNLLCYINGKRLTRFKPQRKYLSILNMGFRKGIMLWNGVVLSGTFPFYFKYYLDSRFMKKNRTYRILNR